MMQPFSGHTVALDFPLTPSQHIHKGILEVGTVKHCGIKTSQEVGAVEGFLKCRGVTNWEILALSQTLPCNFMAQHLGVGFCNVQLSML